MRFIKISLSILIMELRQIIAYRSTFWMKFIGSTLVQFGVSYFIWKSIFSYNQLTTIKGYQFKELLLYYLLAPMIYYVIAGMEMRIIFSDIYEGKLNKYLLYPINVIHFKYLSQLAHILFNTLQFLFFLFAFTLFFDFSTLNYMRLLTLPPLLFLAGVVFFLTAFALEQVSFWADNVWSLSVMHRMVIQFLGGSYIPLALYPEWSQKLLGWLPFSSMIHLPISWLQEKASPQDYLQGCLLLVFWTIGLALINRFIWLKGTKRYSGVGI